MAVSRIAEGKDKINGAELIQGKDGTWGVKFNPATKVPNGVLFQGLPERNLGLQLEDLEKRLKETPSYKTFERRLLQMQIDRLKAVFVGPRRAWRTVSRKADPELPKQVIQEAKNAKDNRQRKNSE